MVVVYKSVSQTQPHIFLTTHARSLLFNLVALVYVMLDFKEF